MPWLVDYVQSLQAIGQTTFQSLPSASMKTIKIQSQNTDILGNLEIQAGKKEDLWWPCYIFIIQYDSEHGWAIDWAIKGLLKTVAHPRSDGCKCVDCHSGKSLPCSGTHSFPWCWHIHADSHHCWRYIHPHLETECVKALIMPSQKSKFPHTT